MDIPITVPTNTQQPPQETQYIETNHTNDDDVNDDSRKSIGGISEKKSKLHFLIVRFFLSYIKLVFSIRCLEKKSDFGKIIKTMQSINLSLLLPYYVESKKRLRARLRKERKSKRRKRKKRKRKKRRKKEKKRQNMDSDSGSDSDSDCGSDSDSSDDDTSISGGDDRKYSDIDEYVLLSQLAIGMLYLQLP